MRLRPTIKETVIREVTFLFPRGYIPREEEHTGLAPGLINVSLLRVLLANLQFTLLSILYLVEQ